MGLQVAESLRGNGFWAIKPPKYTDLCGIDNICELTTFHNKDASDTENQTSLSVSYVLNQT